MKLDRIHQVSEIVASVAIVASLIFVGTQVSQNTNALKLNAATTNAANWQSLLIARASDRDVIKSFIESLEAPEGTALPEVEEVRLGHFLTADLKSAELNYLQWLGRPIGTFVASGATSRTRSGRSSSPSCCRK